MIIGQPSSDPFVATYKDVSSGRYLLLADFESPEQEQLFRNEPAYAPGKIGITRDRARLETGVASIKVSLYTSDQWLVAADSPDGRLTLPRDWTGFEMLVFSVFSPRKLGGFRFAARSGGEELALTYEHPRIFLEMGWNLIRIDLGDLADHIDLGDVRAIQFGCNPLDTPVDLYLDDLLLVNNTRDLLKTPAEQTGDLYVRTGGRRIIVGTLGQFELVFSRGRIIQWFDLGHDPQRIHNLLGTGVLGPSPVLVPNDSENALILLDDATQWAPLGVSVQTNQGMREANNLYVVVEGEWQYGTLDAPADERSPYHRWVYTIFRDGQIFLACHGTARTEHFRPPGVGVAFCCDGQLGFEENIVYLRPPDPAGPGPKTNYAHYVRRTPGQADLLIVPYALHAVRGLKNPQDPRRCTLWTLPIVNDYFLFSAMFRVWPDHLDGRSVADATAADYCQPLPLTVMTGALVRNDPGDFDNDGFSEARGYYVLQLDNHWARVRIERRPPSLFNPAFKVVQVYDREVSVYVNGRPITDLYRNAEGDVIFALPTVPANELLLEVNARPRDAGNL
ncbi:MAG: hypothetical protein GXY44_09900 [Phycisphaerales bacterium]|nr:hypothetical protein [Phycisphaerales bacterium]